jgi:hypothetical protein
LQAATELVVEQGNTAVRLVERARKRGDLPATRTARSPLRWLAVVHQGRGEDLDLIDLRRAPGPRRVFECGDAAGLVTVRQVMTVGRGTPASRTISAFGTPSAASRIIRALFVGPDGTLGSRARSSSFSRSPEVGCPEDVGQPVTSGCG